MQSSESDSEASKYFVCSSALFLMLHTTSMNKYIAYGILNSGIFVLCWQVIVQSSQSKLNCRVLLKQDMIANANFSVFIFMHSKDITLLNLMQVAQSKVPIKFIAAR